MEDDEVDLRFPAQKKLLAFAMLNETIATIYSSVILAMVYGSLVIGDSAKNSRCFHASRAVRYDI